MPLQYPSSPPWSDTPNSNAATVSKGLTVFKRGIEVGRIIHVEETASGTKLIAVETDSRSKSSRPRNWYSEKEFADAGYTVEP